MKSGGIKIGNKSASWISECRASVQKIVLCNSFFYTNNIQKHYSVSRCVISIIIVIAPTHSKLADSMTSLFLADHMD